MPELPEVEEVRRSLEPHVLDVRIVGVRAVRRDFLVESGGKVATVVGQAVGRTVRHGKKLFCVMGEGGATLLFHLGMSGRIDAVPAGEKVLKHTHFVLELAGGMEVRFRDPRRFGGVWFYPSLEAALKKEVKGKMGPDALELKKEDLAHWKKTRGRIKQRLLGQKDVAGLGNIYVDEALWMCGVHPLQRVSRIKAEKVEELVGAIGKVLRQSIEMGGTTLRDYRNVADQPGRFAMELRAYGRGGLACGRCGTAMRQMVVAGRTTVFCGHCQRQR
jgi:formamidopyrimidine-DNA glycosylase